MQNSNIFDKALACIPPITEIHKMVGVNPFGDIAEKIKFDEVFDLFSTTENSYLDNIILEQVAKLITNNKLKIWRNIYKKNNKKWRDILKNIPDNHFSAISYFAQKLDINDYEQYCTNIIFNNSGWFGYLKAHNQLDLYTEVLIFWLANQYFYSKFAITNEHKMSDFEPTKHSYNYKKEKNTQENNIKLLRQKQKHNLNKKNKWILCMDPRSLNVRTAIEKTVQEETHGAAGFFNLPLVIKKDGCHDKYCYPGAQQEFITKKVKSNYFNKILKKLSTAISRQRVRMTSAFVHYELFGIFYLINSILKNFNFYRKNKNSITYNKHDINSKIIKNIQDLFFSMGLDIYNDKLDCDYIYIVGHGSEVNNNQYKSTLQCAACGGNSGLYNAIELCNLLNSINNFNAQFIPIIHDTASNKLELIDKNIDNIKYHNDKISLINNNITTNFPAIKNTNSWSKLVPEFGLINHSCLIIGNSELGINKFKDNQAFMHSYDYKVDPDGTHLANILMGPAFVAYNLNMQYLFSTICNQKFGSGDKTRQSIIPSIGVLENNSFELRFGLPEQSIQFQNTIKHNPSRLFIYIQAPTDIINKALDKAENIKNLSANNFIVVKNITC